MVGKTIATVFALFAIFLMVMVGWLSFTGSQAPAFASDMSKVIVSDEAAKQFDMKIGVLIEEAKAYNEDQVRNARAALTQEEITAKMASMGQVGAGPVPIRDAMVNLREDKIFFTGYVDVPLSAVQIGAVAVVRTSGGRSQVEVDEISFGSLPLPGFLKDYFTEYIITANLAGSGRPPVTLENARIENNQLVLENKKS